MLRLHVLRTRNTSSHQLLKSSLCVPNIIILYRYEISLWCGIDFDSLHVCFFAQNIQSRSLQRVHSVHRIIDVG